MEGGVFILPENTGWEIEEMTPKLRWLDGVLQQAFYIRGPDYQREEWRDVQNVQSPQVTNT